MKRIYLFALCFGVFESVVIGHEQIVHEAITYNAAESAHNESQAYNGFINVISPDLSYTGLNGATNAMVIGSFDEDFGPDHDPVGGYRSLNHFYDPLDIAYGKGLSDFPPDYRVIQGINSFSWAAVLNGIGIAKYGITPKNIWSWQNARAYQLAGLTATDKAERQSNLFQMFRAVGQVIHLLEDTSQPQHVRNEQHLDYYPHTPIATRWHSPIEDFGRDRVRYLNYQHGMLNWRAVGFTKLEDFWDRHLYNGNAQALKDDDAGGPRLGLAEWSNGNFLGDRHSYAEYFKVGDIRRYPFPCRAGTVLETDDLLFKNGHLGKGIYIVKNDNGVRVSHHSRLTSWGVKYPTVLKEKSTTIRDNVVLFDYHYILIPKAIEYSAGLLDYFFRGRLEITWKSSDTGKAKLLIRNVSGQDFSGGEFHLFYDDENGIRTEIPAPDFTTTYATGLPDGDTIDAEFVRPANATSFILVYKGAIGTTGGTALDPVDSNIAIAAARFTNSEYAWGWNGYQDGQTCPWPDDFLAQAGNEELCNGSSSNNRWPGIQGIPEDPRSSVTAEVSPVITLNSHSFSSANSLNDSSQDEIYWRRRIDGGTTGKHVVMHGDWTFPGGEWTETWLDEFGLWVNTDRQAYININLGHDPVNFFGEFIFDENTVYFHQSSPENGVTDYSFDVPPGMIDYACVDFYSVTHDNGPSTLNLTLEITDN